MARFCIENDATKAKASKAVEGIEGLINTMKSAEAFINSAIKTINEDDELENLYFESKQGFVNKLNEEKMSFLRFGDICWQYDQDVNGPFMTEYERVLDLLSDIKAEDIKIPNNIGATETEYYTDNQYGGRDVKTRTKIKETIGFQDVLTYGDIGDLMKQNYENYCKMVEDGKDTYPEFEDYLNGLVTRGEFDYEIPTPWKEYLSIAIDCIPIVGDAKSLIEAVVGVDLVTGRDLSALERSFCLVAIIPLVGDSIKIGGKGAKLAMKSFGEELLKNVVIMSGTSGLASMGINPVLCMGIYAGGKGTKGAINLLKNSDVLKKFELPKRQVLNTIGFKSDEVKKFIKDTKIVNGDYHVTLKQKIEGISGIIFKDSELTPLQKFGCTIGCFTGETLVVTQGGMKEISLIENGERVLTQNEETGQFSYESAELVRKSGSEIITLTIEGNEINTTPEHPFMGDEGWIEADRLFVGARVRNKDNSYKIVENMVRRSYNYVKTYNLTVENNHNFFVSDLGIMVHNTDCKNVTLGEIYKQFGDKIPDPKLRKEFEGLISKLDEIDNAKPISVYISDFDLKFKDIDPSNSSAVRKIIKGTNVDINRGIDDFIYTERLKYYETLKAGVIDDTAWERLTEYCKELDIDMNGIPWDKNSSMLEKFKADILSDNTSMEVVIEKVDEFLKLSDIRLDECISKGYSAEEYYKILNQNKTIRNAEQYLKSLENTKLIDEWSEMFYGQDSKVVISYMPKDSYHNFVLGYGTIGRPGDKGGQFVLPQMVGDSIESKLSEFGSILNSTDKFKVELAKELGLPKDVFSTGVVRVEIPLNDSIGLKIVTGIEDGCNYQWIPGCKTLGGTMEGIIRQITKKDDVELYEIIIRNVKGNIN